MMKFVIIFLLVFSGNVGWSQKRALDTAAYKLWRRVDAPNISEDGKWVTYHFVHIDSKYDTLPRVTYLYNPEKNIKVELRHVVRPSFFANGKWLRYTVTAPEADSCACDSTFLLRLRDMKKVYWDREYDFNEYNTSELITYSYPIDKKSPKYRRFVIRNIGNCDSIVMDSVENCTLLKGHKAIVYIKNHGEYKSLCYRPLKGKSVVIFSDKKLLLKDYSLAHDQLGGTFTVASDTSKMNNPDLFYSFSIPKGECRLLVDWDDVQFPKNYVWRSRAYRLSNDGKRVILDGDTILPVPEKKREKKDTRFELELWTWNDEISSLQQREGNYRSSNVRLAYNLDTKICCRVTSQNMEKLILPEGNKYDYAFALDKTPYRRFSDWKNDINADIYLIDLNTGKTILFERNSYTEPEWSPNGKYALWYNALEKVWYKIDPRTCQRVDLSKEIGYPVHNELHDLPKPAEAYGIAGWSKDGNRVVLYDRYDMWVIDLAGEKPVYSLTGGYGRATNRQFRWLKDDYGDKIIDFENGFLMTSVNLENRDEGIYHFQSNGKLKKLMEGPYSVTVNQKSENQKYCIFTRQGYTEFRDLWWSDLAFTRPVKITNTNPQQENYFWGSVKLVEWTNFEGKRNRGLLYLPEDYDPSKRYPVIVNFYETHTETLHNYIVPFWCSGMLNVISYVSNGYVVFMPDIHFTVGAPGESSYNAVVSGTEMLIDRGIADKDRIGIQGHSWSGYQVAYLVTRTNMFACASPGAAVSSMVSAYTGIRTGSGMPRMFMYEETQSRLGKSLWEDKEMYLRHSPILNADKIQTPLLIFHCDGDEAVPYAEGLNLFLAMRRLQKPAWLLNYKGERHFLFNKAAEVDWTIRLQQFFDHYLKGDPEPRWMREGIHANERGIDQKYDLVK